MAETRRVFLGLALGFMTTAAVSSAYGQGSDAQPGPLAGTIPALPKHDLNALRANERDIRKDVAKLSELVGELEKGLDDNDTKQVLSLDVIHKTEQIEKLAKQIRELVRA